MNNIELVIKIPQKEYNDTLQGVFSIDVFREAVKNGTLLPKCHGDLIDRDEFLLNLGNEHIGGIEAIKDYTGEDTWTDGLHTAWRIIDDMSAIIEADKENKKECSTCKSDNSHENCLGCIEYGHWELKGENNDTTN